MRRSSRMSALAAAGTVVALLATGCGSDAEPEADETSPVEPAATDDADTSGPTDDGTATDGGTAADADWQAIVDQAAGQSVLVYHAASPEQFDRFIAAFNEEYPDITLTHERGGREILDRVVTELETGTAGADAVMWPDQLWFEDNAGSFAELQGPHFAEFPESGVSVDEKVAIPQILVQSMIVWNTQEFPDGFDSFQDVLDNVPPGRIGSRDLYSGPLCSYYDYLENEWGPGFLEQLGKLDPVAYGNTGESAQAVAAGEVGVVIEMQPANIYALIDEGAPLDFKIIEDPGVGVPYHVGVIESSPNAAAAQVFVDYLLSEEGQTVWNGEGYAASVMSGLEGVASTDGWVIYDHTQYPEEAVEECSARIDEVVFGR